MSESVNDNVSKHLHASSCKKDLQAASVVERVRGWENSETKTDHSNNAVFRRMLDIVFNGFEGWRSEPQRTRIFACGGELSIAVA